MHILIDKSSSEFTNDIVQLIPCLKYCKLKAFYHFVLQNHCSYANKEQFMDRMQMEILLSFTIIIIIVITENVLLDYVIRCTKL